MAEPKCKQTTVIACRHKFPLYVSQDFNASGVQDVVAQVGGWLADSLPARLPACSAFLSAAGCLFGLRMGWHACPASPLPFSCLPFPSPGILYWHLQHLDRISFLQHQELQEPQRDNKKEKVVYYRIANHYK